MERMTEYRIGLGIDFDRHDRLLSDDARCHAIHAIKKHAITQFGGYHIAYGSGGWINANGDLVEEAAITLTIITHQPYSTVTGFAQWAATRLNQAAYTLADGVVGHADIVDVEYLTD